LAQGFFEKSAESQKYQGKIMGNAGRRGLDSKIFPMLGRLSAIRFKNDMGAAESRLCLPLYLKRN